MGLIKIKINVDGKEEEIEVEESELEAIQFDANVCTPGDEKCVGHILLKCKVDGSGYFKKGTC